MKMVMIKIDGYDDDDIDDGSVVMTMLIQLDDMITIQ